MPPVVAAAAFVGAAVGVTGAIAAPLVGGALIGAVTGGAIAAVQGKDVFKGALKGALIGAVVGGVGGILAPAASTVGIGTEAAGDSLLSAIKTGTSAGFGSGELSTTGTTSSILNGGIKEAATPTASSFLNSRGGAATIMAGGNAIAGLMSPDPMEAVNAQIKANKEAQMSIPTVNGGSLGTATVKPLPTAQEMISQSTIDPNQQAQGFIDWTKEAYKINPNNRGVSNA